MSSSIQSKARNWEKGVWLASPGREITHQEADRGIKMEKKRTGTRFSVNNSKESSSSSAAASMSSTSVSSSSVVECSGRTCKSCSANAVGDCVALCCCPCALVSILFLTFLKVPWVLGRGLLSRKRRKNREKKMNKKAASIDAQNQNHNQNHNQNQNGRNLFDEWEKEVSRMRMDGLTGSNWVAGYEAERVWLELYQAGHAGFGRVSFTT